MLNFSSKDITELLLKGSSGDQDAINSLMTIVYEELRKLASHYLNNERPGHTLQPTALVHEVYLRLIDYREIHWQNRAHFFAISAQLMRRILVDYARQNNAGKRRNDLKIPLDETMQFSTEQEIELVVLDDALVSLAAIDPLQSRIVELRFFSGLSIEETAEVLELSPATVKREWKTAKLWLYRETVKQ